MVRNHTVVLLGCFPVSDERFTGRSLLRIRLLLSRVPRSRSEQGLHQLPQGKGRTRWSLLLFVLSGFLGGQPINLRLLVKMSVLRRNLAPPLLIDRRNGLSAFGLVTVLIRPLSAQSPAIRDCSFADRG